MFFEDVLNLKATRPSRPAFLFFYYAFRYVLSRVVGVLVTYKTGFGLDDWIY
jgi:hypothetical protein